MTIDLKWGLPFVFPFLIMALVRGLSWAAGLEWTQDDGYEAFGVSLSFGGFVGVFAVVWMHLSNTKWLVRLWGHGQ